MPASIAIAGVLSAACCIAAIAVHARTFLVENSDALFEGLGALNFIAAVSLHGMMALSLNHHARRYIEASPRFDPNRILSNAAIGRSFNAYLFQQIPTALFLVGIVLVIETIVCGVTSVLYSTWQGRPDNLALRAWSAIAILVAFAPAVYFLWLWNRVQEYLAMALADEDKGPLMRGKSGRCGGADSVGEIR